jgi:class 3 adenylate cyclase
MINRRFSKPAIARHLRCCCGIDTGEMLAVKIGLRGNTDLLWSGRPANFAAKLCAQRQPTHSTVITGRVFQRLADDLKRSGDASFWKRFKCDGIDMVVFGSDTVMPIQGV